MLLSVGLGDALGALSRYLISLWVTGTFGQSGRMAILSVNVAGSMMLAGGLYLLASVCLSVEVFYIGLLVVRLVAGQG